MRLRSRNSRRIQLALVLAVVLVLPALAVAKQPYIEAPSPTGRAADHADGGTTEPLWQFETGG